MLGYRQNVWGKSCPEKTVYCLPYGWLVGVEFNAPLDTVGHFAGGFALCLEPQHCLKALYYPVLKDFLFFNILNISSDIYCVALTVQHG